MYAQCPHCSTVFRITDAMLDAADGEVRCGQCREVFDARPALHSTPPAPSLGAALPERPSAPDLDAALPERPSAPLGMDEEELRAILETPVPATTPSRKTHTAAWAMACLLALVTLAIQLSYFERDRLAARPWLRPWVEAACTVIGCELPDWRDLAAIRLLDSDVREHPRIGGALLVNVTFVNTATRSQPFPTLQIVLTGLSDAAVARRHLRPAKYLATTVDRKAGMAPGQPIHITVELAAPTDAVEGFRLALS